MPGFDGTGPQGRGPMTGGARGYCNPYGAGRGVPFGGRFARPYRGVFPVAPVDTVTEISVIRAEADSLKAQLQQIEARIAELENK